MFIYSQNKSFVSNTRNKRRITVTNMKSPHKNDTVIGKVQKYLSKKRNENEFTIDHHWRNESMHSLYRVSNHDFIFQISKNNLET